MRTYDEIIITDTRTVLACMACDICGRVVKNPPLGDSWLFSPTFGTVVVKCVIGESCGDLVDRKTTTFDICPECFDKKLVPWLESLGAKPTVVEEQDEYTQRKSGA